MTKKTPSRFYNHDVVNLAGEGIGCTLDLSRIVAVGYSARGVFPVYIAGAARPVECFATDDAQRQRLVDAWTAYENWLTN